ncbi:mannose-1-phosphate guanylyltransferase/mannose-6-phosphate isomerase [Chromatiales bacterium (ex Bugula neritina AB1)]|nr:mannose-1-phosphate guanylyltransferase/mannose-6-phosphate isomerase [Chromatiales bacterium (ex Bugula neritina AB1)]
MHESVGTNFPVILAGGSGTRLWPLSRSLYPKQFLRLGSSLSLLQNTVSRAESACDGKLLIVCNEEHRFLTAEQLREMDSKGTIILEPVARNTAPAIALAALHALTINPEAMLTVLAADHLIEDTNKFNDHVTQATEAARDGALVTFGVIADRPETGYGYIKAESSGISKIATFEEKPNIENAKKFIESGDYYWNSGMFVFRAQSYLDALQTYAPAVLKACTAAHAQRESDLDFIRIDEAAFAESDSISVDYAVMEKTNSAMVVPFQAGWSDIGSWDAVHAISKKDENGNATTGDAMVVDSENCYINAGSRLVAALGLQNISIIETQDSILVTNNENAQNAKLFAQKLKDAGRNEADTHTQVFRPWGSYQTINLGNRFQVKRITVKPGAKLSLQKHHHRAEHWVVVEGTAIVTCDDNEIMLTENQSTYLPLGAIHRLENPGKIPLELIEVQSGSYLGEDDIVRFDDVYGRAPE